MIHSLSGGKLKDNKNYDFVKVKILEELYFNKISFYISNISSLQEGDVVLVPYGFPIVKVKARVLRIDKNVNEQVAPIPIKRMKEIIKKLTN